ncbi:NADH dehydrogenase [ubiquinone] 1 subunit C2 [Orussus abietinus]|uniref:NADH dehydrogenase [ubiquinone] 1 subunit C2 n=1 Tax=Orussus abietinus TaxID=222816 RepID=UPI000625EE8B|nr:NADH dehydrogenase [ubiquinone] 1 subunit C2 [Orussus abietinus]
MGETGKMMETRTLTGKQFFFTPKPEDFSTDGQTDNSWAIELLTGHDVNEGNALLYQYWHVFGGATTGIAVACAYNLLRKRPLYAGIQRHIICGLIGTGIGYLCKTRYLSKIATRDAILRDYIKLHPEDFPPPIKRTFGEVFMKWTPIR